MSITQKALGLGLLLGLSACSLFSGPRSEPNRPVATSPSSSAPDPRALDQIPDAVPRPEPRSARGNPPFYEVFGKRYHVMASSTGYREQGIASWYGPTFHTRPTSSGEAYDMYAMTAAHKSLPLPTYVRVTHLGNGRSIIVRVNDRGPFVGERIIDLSYTAAHKLDMTRAGTAFVEVEALQPGSLDDAARALLRAQTPTSALPPKIYAQAGAFAAADNAQRLAARLRQHGLDSVEILSPLAGSALYRVRLGPVADVAGYDALVAQLKQLGIVPQMIADSAQSIP